jgi:hypothetical protein
VLSMATSPDDGKQNISMQYCMMYVRAAIDRISQCIEPIYL